MLPFNGDNILTDSEQQQQQHVSVVTRRAFSRAYTSPQTLIFELDLPKFNHLVPCGQGYD